MVNVGVKQSCVLAPVIFNLFLVAETLLFLNGGRPEDCLGVNYRLEGSLFNIRRLQAETKVESTRVFELQYADDAALPSHTAAGLQRNLDTLTESYQRAGLTVNVIKTKVLTQVTAAQTSTTPAFSVASSNLNNVQQFTYLGSWASIIVWTGGQVPPLFEAGGRNVFCPPTFWGNKYLVCVNLLFSCY